MKKLNLFVIIAAMITGWSCMRNEYLVESDYSYAGIAFYRPISR